MREVTEAYRQAQAEFARPKTNKQLRRLAQIVTRGLEGQPELHRIGADHWTVMTAVNNMIPPEQEELLEALIAAEMARVGLPLPTLAPSV